MAKVTALVQKYGGAFLARTARSERLEGDRSVPQVLVLTEWPDRASAQRFYQSEEYAPYLQKRLAGSRGQFMLVPGEDLANH